MNKNRIIALDADGVLLNYNLAYAAAWQQAFRVYPKEKDPKAYWAQDRWDVELLEGDRLAHFRAHFNEAFFESLHALPGAIQACKNLKSAGYRLVCVTALRVEFAAARQRNLQRLGFPIEMVLVTGNLADGKSPKAEVLHLLRPSAFVDDYLPYMEGVTPGIHRALITRDPHGSPNTGDALMSVASTHNNLWEFSEWWLSTEPAEDQSRTQPT